MQCMYLWWKIFGYKLIPKQTHVFVKPTCGEQDIVVTTTVQCMCVCPSVQICENHNSTVVDGFQNNLRQVFSNTCRCAI